MKTTAFTTSCALLLASGLSLQAIDTWSDGHGDFGLGVEDNALHFHAHLHSGAAVNGSPLGSDAEYEPADVLVQVPEDAKIAAPTSIPALDLLTGEDLWLLPQSNPPTSMPFLGIATEELTPSDWTGDIVFSLGAVTSPSGNGYFALRQFNSQTVSLDYYFSSRGDAYTEDNNLLALSAGTHAHFDWLFTEIGTWTIELTAGGTHNTLGALSDTQTFTFNVVPEPATYGFALGALALLAAWCRRRAR